MQKIFNFIFLFVSISTIWLLFFTNDNLTSFLNFDTNAPKTKKIDISLNEFLEKYKSWDFVGKWIVVLNETNMEWYQYIELTWQNISVDKSWNVKKYYDKYLTQKPVWTSLSDLWFVLTWSETPINIKFVEKSFFTSLLGSTWELIIAVIVFMIVIKYVLWRWWWMWWLPFGSKIWKLTNNKENTTKFSDIAGMEEVKEELKEIVDYLKNPKKYQDVWARPPKWILLYGIPGSGKTLLARAVAWESDASFYSVSGSEFMEMLVGMWAAKVRELFTKAKATAPSIIFIDEIDTIWRKRWGWYTWWHQEQEQTLNQILTEMDGFSTNTNVIVMWATNRPDTLDSALLRSGRFDRKIMVSAPTLEERILIFEYYLKDKKISDDIDVRSIAKRTSGFVGADLENMVNEASLKLAKENRTKLQKKDFEYALEKVVMWPEKKIKSINEKERNIIAYHELGHAITAYNLSESDPVEKISIVSRGKALGVTWTLPQEDTYLYSKIKFLHELIKLLGGRASEEIFFGIDNVTTWASNDFERATNIAKDMVMKYWMDEELGQINYFNQEESEFGFNARWYSEQTAEKIDFKIKQIIKECYEKSKEIIIENKQKIEKISTILLEKEYLDREEFEELMK